MLKNIYDKNAHTKYLPEPWIIAGSGRVAIFHKHTIPSEDVSAALGEISPTVTAELYNRIEQCGKPTDIFIYDAVDVGEDVFGKFTVNRISEPYSHDSPTIVLVLRPGRDWNRTIIHELVHYDQWLRGDLVYDEEGSYWKGRRQTPTPDGVNLEYILKPLELEARRKTIAFFCHCSKSMATFLYWIDVTLSVIAEIFQSKDRKVDILARFLFVSIGISSTVLSYQIVQDITIGQPSLLSFMILGVGFSIIISIAYVALLFLILILATGLYVHQREKQ